MTDFPLSKLKKYWKRALAAVFVVLAFVFIFDLAPFTTTGLFSQSDMYAATIQKYILTPGIPGGYERLDPVRVTDADGLSRVREILSKYQFRRNLFSPQRDYTEKVAIIELMIGYDEDKYFTLEITDPTVGSLLSPGSLLSVSKYRFAVENRDHSIDYVGHKQQDKLYGELDDFLSERGQSR